MNKHRINITFSCFTWKKYAVKSIVTKCIEQVLKSENVPVSCEINVLIADDAQIQSINQQSRGIDQPTDVLSFPMFQFIPGNLPPIWDSYMDPETNMSPLGDMVISLERAIMQANEFGHSMRREVGYLTIHSVLHLLGYDHLDEGPEKARMRKREEEIAALISGMQRKEDN